MFCFVSFVTHAKCYLLLVLRLERLYMCTELTDWALRDLTPEQLEYAALDAAVTPKLMEKVLESIEADISIDQLVQQEPPDDVPNPSNACEPPPEN